jgi:hypothetical protein
LQTANNRGQPCGLSVTQHDVNKCNDGLSKCSPDDVTAIDNYAKCLNNLPVCDPSTKTSWALEALGCNFTSISLMCSTAIF